MMTVILHHFLKLRVLFRRHSTLYDTYMQGHNYLLYKIKSCTNETLANCTKREVHMRHFLALNSVYRRNYWLKSGFIIDANALHS